ncbi:MAG: hypothetical protein LBP24_02320 [Coriobacteriales bacterium]|nr:hypothetical protein [Coriobacteriales bacterium]
MNTNERESQDAFERLQALMERLPEMQEKGASLSRAREARRLIALRGQTEALEQEYASYQRIYDTALAAAQEADVRGDSGALARERGIARSYAELIATRTAPLQRAREALAAQWESSSFAPGELPQLADAALDEATFAALEQEVASYQQDFQETYALCKKLEGEAEPG